MGYKRSQVEKFYAEGSDDFRALRRPESKAPKIKDRLAPGMNKTEARYRDVLYWQKRHGEIRNYRYTGHRRRLLKLGDRGWYNPDFCVVNLDGSVDWIEIKGPYIRPVGKKQFDWARERYPQYRFRMMQEEERGAGFREIRNAKA